MSDALSRLQEARAEGRLRPLDLHFAHWMARFAGERANDELLLAAALVSRRVGQGDVCLPLDELSDDEHRLTEIADVGVWCSRLLQTPVVGEPGAATPLILDQAKRLYLARYHDFEARVEQALAARVSAAAPGVDEDRLRAGLERLFPPRPGVDWQRVAAALAVLQSFCVISGGPGTGKTHTVTAILALLLEQTGGTGRIALAAPTGKAAARLTESIRTARTRLAMEETVRQAIPDEATTIHRLLGMRPGRAEPRFGLERRLPLDVLVIDEASMIDLPLMARVLAALPEQARLILLGDRDQLASVEAGRVLGDLCGREGGAGYSPQWRQRLHSICAQQVPEVQLPPIANHIALLRESRRFHDNSGIGALARAVNSGDPTATLAVTAEERFTDIALYTPSESEREALIDRIVVPAYRDYLRIKDPAQALAAFDRFRVLTALRSGPWGEDGLNEQIESALARNGLTRPAFGHYPGRPVLITENDNALKLFNGDIGLILPDTQAQGRLRAFFPTTEGVRRILPTRLPAHRTVYAMTVHKSQGSEFDTVLLVLPQQDSPILTRELIYTGLTRARNRLVIWGEPELLSLAVSRTVHRTSGLWEKMWGDGER